MKNKILKPSLEFMLLVVMALTFVMNSNNSGNYDLALENIMVLNQANAEDTVNCVGTQGTCVVIKNGDEVIVSIPGVKQ